MNLKQHAEGDGRTEAAHDARVMPDRRRDEVRRRRWQPASNGAPERRPFIQLNAIFHVAAHNMCICMSPL